MKKIQIIPKKLSRHRKDLDFIVFQQPVNATGFSDCDYPYGLLRRSIFQKKDEERIGRKQK